MEKAYLLLGCQGRKEHNFLCCSGIENVILTITENHESLDWLANYLKAFSIYDRPVKDYNAIRRMLFTIKDKYTYRHKPIWDDNYFKLLEEFTINHKNCGLYVRFVID